MTDLNATHDPDLKSWIETANDPACDFPIQNLPFGVFSTPADPAPRPGVAIGDQILDLAVMETAELLPTPDAVFRQPTLNAFMALGPAVWSKTRAALSELLAAGASVLGDDVDLKSRALTPLGEAQMHLPFLVTEFTDFYASKEHATNVGRMFRDPDNALMPNWLHIPIGYNGRASSVVVSGTDIHRPRGQLKGPDDAEPRFGASEKLDIELEMGAVVGMGNALGTPLSTGQANAMIFGFVLLNDWSARDIQVWEYQPLGPFQAKAFATTISPWVVTQEALAPFRVDGPTQNPAPLAYLRQDGPHNFDINLSIALQPDSHDAKTDLSRTNFKYMYWSSAQQLTHHASSGCAMRTGDLLGSGTISGPTPGQLGCLLEMSKNGSTPIDLTGGGTRTFIEDGDTLTLGGWCQGDGFRVGFGTACGKILPAVSEF